MKLLLHSGENCVDLSLMAKDWGGGGTPVLPISHVQIKSMMIKGFFLRERLLCLLGLSLPGTNSPIEETLTIFTYWRPSKKYMLIRCWRDITRQHIGGGLDRLIDWLIDFPVMSSEVSSGPSADRTDRIDTDWKLLRVALFSVLSAQYYQLIITEDTPRDK